MDETGQPYAYTGDDPVNEADPTGLDIFLTLPASAARLAGEVLNGAQYTLQFLDSRLGPVGAAAVAALEYVNRLLGLSDPGDGLLNAADEADTAVANSGRHQKSEGIVRIDIFTVSIFGFDTKIPTGGYYASGSSRRARTTSDVTGCNNGGTYV